MRYDRGRQSLDRHATYIVATFVAGAITLSPIREDCPDVEHTRRRAVLPNPRERPAPDGLPGQVAYRRVRR